MAFNKGLVFTQALSDPSIKRTRSNDVGYPHLMSWWKMALIKFGIFLLAIGPVFALVFCTAFYYWPGDTLCLANGNVAWEWLPAFRYLWDPSLIIDISLGWGRLSFTAVKVIDVIWDVVVGRGGQAVLSIISYTILSKALLHSMESRPATFERYAATSYDIGSFWALLALCQDLFSKRHTKRSIWVLLATVFVTIYLIAYSTIISAITGYQAVTTAYTAGDDGTTLIRLQDLQMVTAVIRDGSRVGLPDNYNITGASQWSGYDFSLGSSWYESPGYWNWLNVTYYYNFYPRYKSSMGAQIPCNASNAEIPEELRHCDPQDMNSSITINGQLYNLSAPSLTIDYLPNTVWNNDSLFSYNGALLSGPWIIDHGVCKPDDQYQWGFTFLGLFAFVLYTMVFTLILYFVWRDTYWHSHSARTAEGIGSLRAAVDMSAALRAGLGDECSSYSNEMLVAEVRAKGLLMGGRSGETKDDDDWRVSRKEIKKEAKRERKARKRRGGKRGDVELDLRRSETGMSGSTVR